MTKQKTDLPPTHANVAGRDVGIRSNVPLQFGHEALAETHHFVIALALGIKIRSSLAAAHGQCGERVLEDLFECEELEDSEIHRGMEAESAFVGSDGAIHLNAETPVHLNIAQVVEPGHAKHNDPLGL